ncbi:MAG: ABC transporter ATP-binding protein [Pseudoclavibacter sp.]
MLLEAKEVSKTFRVHGSTTRVHAVKGTSIQARPGGFVAVVGESGSGKSTLARMLLGLIPPSSGTIEFDGVDLATMNRAQHREYRQNVQAVLQDPAGSLNPRKTVGQTIGDVVRLDKTGPRRRARERAVEVLERVGLEPADRFLDRYPNELSGGQRQRVLIARAIVLDPQIIIADEAVSALDASVKAGVLRLLDDLRLRLGVGYVFITHDLPVVRKVADYVYVMKDGEVVEEGETEQIFTDPGHSYTAALVRASLTLESAV